MRSSHSLDRLEAAFDDDRLVPDAGLILPATLAHHLGLQELVDEHLDLGARPGRANVGDKFLTLVMSALAGGDHIDHADALRAGGTGRVLGFTVKAASTLGTFLRSFRWGHVRQLDRVSRELLARAWAAGAGPGASPLTIDLDSTICETYGLQKEGALHHTYTHVRGYHPLLAVAAGTGDVLMARLREGRANTGRGAGHFLRETIGRVRYAGATRRAHGPGRLRLLHPRGGGGLPQAEGPLLHHGPPEPGHPATDRGHPGDAWTPIPYWIDGGADVAETTYTPFSGPSRAPARSGSSCAGCGRPPAPSSRCSRSTTTTPSSPTARAGCWSSRPTIAGTPRSRTPSGTSSTAWGSTICRRAGSPPTAPGWRSR